LAAHFAVVIACDEQRPLQVYEHWLSAARGWLPAGPGGGNLEPHLGAWFAARHEALVCVLQPLGESAPERVSAALQTLFEHDCHVVLGPTSSGRCDVLALRSQLRGDSLDLRLLSQSLRQSPSHALCKLQNAGYRGALLDPLSDIESREYWRERATQAEERIHGAPADALCDRLEGLALGFGQLGLLVEPAVSPESG
jgi:hypothetical protein